MSNDIQIVDRGRGPQLSTSRVTVLDVVPYFQDGCSYEEIQQWIPTLSREEIAAAEGYYRAHQQVLDDEDRRIRERASARTNPPWVEKIAEDARAERLENLRRSKDNGAMP